jgi:hypothetical protein
MTVFPAMKSRIVTAMESVMEKWSPAIERIVLENGIPQAKRVTDF